MNNIYMDNGATTKAYPEVIEYVTKLLNTVYANPSSVNYEDGLDAKKVIESARETVAERINAYPDEIYFTPSASFANNQAIIGYMNKHLNCHNFITSNIEHSSLLNIEFSRPYVWKNLIKCDNNGLLHKEQFEGYSNCLISVMGANNEVGSIQPIREIADVVHKNNNIFHSDLSQYAPYKKVDVKKLGLDLATIDPHKLHGIKGCGILYVKNGIELSPIVYGGGQENNLIGGTENIYAIGAANIAFKKLNYEKVNEIKDKRDYFIDKLLENKNITLNGLRENRIAGNINITIHNISIDNQQLSAMADVMYGYKFATGSSCHTYEHKPSHVLKALELSDEDIRHSIRITIDNDITIKEIDRFVFDLNNIITQFYIKND